MSQEKPTPPDPTLQDIYLARRRIAPIIQHTPLIPSPRLSAAVGGQVALKLENQQRTGAFKLRGAANKLLSLTQEEKARGVITVSTGNHGRAVAYAARRLDLRAVICLSRGAAPVKIQAIRDLGAEIVLHGASYDEAFAHSLELQKTRGLTYIEPFDEPLVIAGQGTIGLELLEEMPDLEAVVVPLSGGGLISGIALALKSANPAIQVVGVSMDRAPVMVHSLRAGRVLELPEEETLADALVGGLGDRNRYTFRLVQRYVDQTFLVSEAEIAAAMAFAFEQERQVVEGGGAVGLAALLHGKIKAAGRRLVVILSGGNIQAARLLQVIQAPPPP